MTISRLTSLFAFSILSQNIRQSTFGSHSFTRIAKNMYSKIFTKSISIFKYQIARNLINEVTLIQTDARRNDR